MSINVARNYTSRISPISDRYFATAIYGRKLTTAVRPFSNQENIRPFSDQNNGRRKFNVFSNREETSLRPSISNRIIRLLFAVASKDLVFATVVVGRILVSNDNIKRILLYLLKLRPELRLLIPVAKSRFQSKKRGGRSPPKFSDAAA